MNRNHLWFPLAILAVGVPLAWTLGSTPVDAQESALNVPRTWDEVALVDWATPLAGLNARPTHISTNEYYALRVENLRTYPVYFPDREPAGYWDMMQQIGPKPLIEPEKLKSEADWINAGLTVFEQVDDLQLRTFAPQFITAARSRDT